MQTNTPIDKILNGGIERRVITNIYGPAGCGKTNIALSTLLSAKKSIYIDTESSFSPERFYQIGGTSKKMESIILIEPSTWQEQHAEVVNLESKMKGVELIIIDSIVSLYRLELDRENYSVINRQLAMQYALLAKIARDHDIPILVTNQVYSTGEDTVEMSSRQVARYWSKCIVELKLERKPSHRTAILQKHRSLPEGKKITFEIKQSGLQESKFDFMR